MTKTATAAAPKATVEKKTAAPKAEKKTEAAPAKVSASADKKVAAPKAVVAPVVAAQAVAEAASAVPEITWNEELKTLQTTVEAQITSLKSVLANLKRVEKRVSKEIKDAKKKRKVARKVNADGTPVVVPFKAPKRITDDLGLFLGKGKNASASRSEVTQALCAYIKEKGLGQGRFIKGDAALLKLLAIGASDELTYTSLQTHINQFFIKTA